MRSVDLPLERIAWRDRRYSFSRPDDTAALESSLKKTGLIDPPDLIRHGRRCVVFRGRRRLLALKRLGRRTARVNLFDEEDISPLEAWTMNFHDTTSRRPLNSAEACTAVRQLLDLGLDRKIVSAGYLARLGLPRKPGAIKKYLAVAGLEERILDALAAGDITLPTASFLAAFDAGDRRSAFGFLRRRPLTVGGQREFVRLVADISARDFISVGRLLASVSRAAARRSGHRGAAALRILRERRYPALAERRKQFQDVLRRLKLPPTMRIETHPAFERNELTCTFTARDADAWKRALALLEKAGSEPDLMRLLGKDNKRKRR